MKNKILSGTFDVGCGVIVSYGNDFYHLIVFKDENGCYVEIKGNRIYKEEFSN